MEREHVLEGAFRGHDRDSKARARSFDHSSILKSRESDLDVVAQTQRYINHSSRSMNHNERGRRCRRQQPGTDVPSTRYCAFKSPPFFLKILLKILYQCSRARASP